MNLSRRSVAVLVALMIIALGGLVGLQVYLLQLALEQKEQAFKQNVQAALTSVAQRLEGKEAYTIAVQPNGSAPSMGYQWQFNISTSVPAIRDSLCVEGLFIETDGIFGRQMSEAPVTVEDGVLRYELRHPQHVTIKVYDQTHGIDKVVVDTFKTAGTYEINLENEPFAASQAQVMYMFRTDSSEAIFQLHNGMQVTPITPQLARSRKEEYMKRMVSNLVVAELEPIEQRVSNAELDTLISSALHEAGINTGYEYAVFSGMNDSLRMPSMVKAASELRRSEFRTRLFPSDMLSARSELALHFPDRAAYLWKQMSVLVISNLAFIAIIMLVFAYTIRVILAQKRFSVRIVDFINNMTHEFKTPISTVALASEAIMRPDVISQPERVGKYGRMILDENQRMRHQVEKILQMAVIEEGDYELKLGEVDLNQIVRKAVEGISLQVENRGGQIEALLEADRAVVKGDSLHLSNIVNNLIDNAIKYSPEAPQITASTRNEGDEIIVTISDKGIGINEADQKAVFEKYYRVHSGNIHNVKGFGLGLSYVKMMVDAHGGKIDLRSKLGEGTTIELRFATAKEDDDVS